MKKQILLFFILFVPVIWLNRIMDSYLPNMSNVNTTVCVVLLYFMYVACTIKTEIVTIKETKITKKKHKHIKQVYTTDGRCFEVWTGFDKTTSYIHGDIYIHMFSRLSDAEFKKLKQNKNMN